MKNFLQQAGMIFLALILTFSILYFFRNSKHFGISDNGQQNAAFEVLDTSLDLLGQRIVDLVQNEDEKKDAAADFSNFRERVYRQEVAPDELEQVIAKVYGLSMETNVMTPEEVKRTLKVPDLPPMPDSMLFVKANKKRLSMDSLQDFRIPFETRTALTEEALLERYSNIARITVFEHTIRQKSKKGNYPTTIEIDSVSGLRVRLDSVAYQHFLSGADEKLRVLTENLALDNLILIENQVADYEGLLQQDVFFTHEGDSIAVKMQTEVKSGESIRLPRAFKTDIRKDFSEWKDDVTSPDTLKDRQH